MLGRRTAPPTTPAATTTRRTQPFRVRDYALESRRWGENHARQTGWQAHRRSHRAAAYGRFAHSSPLVGEGRRALVTAKAPTLYTLPFVPLVPPARHVPPTRRANSAQRNPKNLWLNTLRRPLKSIRGRRGCRGRLAIPLRPFLYLTLSPRSRSPLPPRATSTSWAPARRGWEARSSRSQTMPRQRGGIRRDCRPSPLRTRRSQAASSRPPVTPTTPCRHEREAGGRVPFRSSSDSQFSASATTTSLSRTSGRQLQLLLSQADKRRRERLSGEFSARSTWTPRSPNRSATCSSSGPPSESSAARRRPCDSRQAAR